MGYKELTPIQEKTFEAILSGRDLLARAETELKGTMVICSYHDLKRTPSSKEMVDLLA